MPDCYETPVGVLNTYKTIILKMGKLMIFCVIVLIFTNTHALSQTTTDTACANASSQLERYKCLSSQYTKTDKELNTIYGKILIKMKKDNSLGAINVLKVSERKWIVYRNSFGKVYQELYKGGSIMPLTVLECEIQTTRLRIIELNNLFADINR
jgi:uncharacterized protein YecT (DUF1311 family)